MCSARAIWLSDVGEKILHVPKCAYRFSPLAAKILPMFPLEAVSNSAGLWVYQQKVNRYGLMRITGLKKSGKNR